MKRPPYQVRLSELADRDFLEIMDWSAGQFGDLAADRYETLIGQALIDLADDPFRPGARQRDDLPAGTYTYHLIASRNRVIGDHVKSPRHFVVYRVKGPHIDVLRFLHDSRDLAQHLQLGD